MSGVPPVLPALRICDTRRLRAWEYRGGMVEVLPADAIARLRGQQLTYDQVGATLAGGPAGDGWHTLSRTRILDRRDFEALAEELLSWQVQERVGLRVASSETPLQQGTVVVMRLGLGPLALRIPCRVVDAGRSEDRAWFVYGTLPGHPECGEESFSLRRLDDGSVRMRVEAFSRPASLPARLGGPAARAFQRIMADRYLRSLDR